MNEKIKLYTKTAKYYPYATMSLSFLFGVSFGGIWVNSITQTRFTAHCAFFYILALITVFYSFMYFSKEVPQE